MRIGKRLFPYPTINNSKNISTFIKSNYSLDYDCLISDETNFIIKNAKVVIENDNILKLVSDDFLKIALIVECSATIYRKTFDIGTVPKDIEIPVNNLRDKVEISCYIYVNKPFIFSDEDFMDDYKGYEFEMEKYDIIAIDDGFTTRIEYDEENDKKVSSMFSIIAKEDIDEEIIQVEKALNKVFIYMSDNSIKQYNSLKDNDNYQNMFFAIIIVPALISVLQELQSDIKYNDITIDDIKLDYKWFETIENAYENIYSKKLTNEIFKTIDVVELSQKLINNATINSINDTFTNTFKNMITDGEEDE